MVKEHQAGKVLKVITPGWSMLDNFIYSRRRQIWIIWDQQVIGYDLLKLGEQFIHAEVKVKARLKFTFTTIYGLHTIETKKILWEELRSIYTGQQVAWLALGYFNNIHKVEDKMIGSIVHDSEIEILNPI